mmetsp:Transcript_3966/g.11530  ORF Transcript_3966/g.11530 Transcript_3966/m.11530 type:complete len:212 (+) Transcript_3966:315-950(+)
MRLSSAASWPRFGAAARPPEPAPDSRGCTSQGSGGDSQRGRLRTSTSSASPASARRRWARSSVSHARASERHGVWVKRTARVRRCRASLRPSSACTARSARRSSSVAPGPPASNVWLGLGLRLRSGFGLGLGVYAASSGKCRQSSCIASPSSSTMLRFRTLRPLRIGAKASCAAGAASAKPTARSSIMSAVASWPPRLRPAPQAWSTDPKS